MAHKHTITVDASLCNGCGLCVKDCTYGLFAVSGGKAEHAQRECLECGHCVAVCPQNAVSMSGFDDEPEEFSHDMTLEPDTLMALHAPDAETGSYKKYESSASVLADYSSGTIYTYRPEYAGRILCGSE